ncbi:MAG TPA: response regulator [Nitrospirales bacterium]|nr:response regulator [Nitrospirales bacterium]
MSRKPIVLIVHADAEMRGVLFSLLDRAGYLAGTCASGIDALKYVAEARPDAVLCGSRLMDMEGRELLSKVRSMAPVTRLILLGGAGDSGRPEMSGESPIEVLHRPVCGPEILTILQTMTIESAA